MAPKALLLALIISICCFTATLQAQTSESKLKANSDNTLLWRISGKNLVKSSYLFGTMHLKDKRLFNFDDSVYRAIEKCDGMAIEVNPHEMVAYMVNELFDNMQKDKLKNILSYKDYQRYSNDLSKKFKKPADEISTADIIREKNRWMNDYMRKGEMPTFVDAYLYNIARKQGKWVGGIEDITDQAGLIEDNIDKSDIEYILVDDAAPNTTGKTTMEKMISLYRNQDLDGIDEFMNGFSDSTSRDHLLIKRNIKMAQRMDSLSALRTMFFAIGAAHLKGDSGVIELLQKRGFTVEPVFSKIKIDQKNYKPKEIEIPWVNVEDEKQLYEVSMPLAPTPIKLFGLVNMNFLVDIFTYSGYYTVAVPITLTASNRDSILNVMAAKLTKANKKLKGKPIAKDEIKGLEFNSSSDEFKMKLHLYTQENIVYAVAMFTINQSALQSPQATRYFESFKIKKPDHTAQKRNYLFVDSVMGAQVESPAELTKNKQFSSESNDTWKITGYAGTDMNTGTVVMLFSREAKPGHSIISDSLIYEEHNTVLKTSHHSIQKKELITNEGKVVEYTAMQNDNPNLRTTIHSSIRNNKSIVLIVVSDTSNYRTPLIKNIFSSLKFIIPPVKKWNWYSDDKKRVTLWLPDAVRYFGDQNLPLAYDTTTSTSYFIRIDTLSKYTWFTSDSAVDKTMFESSENSETVYVKNISRSNLTGKEILQRVTNNHNLYTRLMFLASDSVVYKFALSGGKNLITNANTNKFFDSVIIHKQGGNKFIFTSKSKLLIGDLEHPDQSVRYDADNALESAPFVQADLPLLHDALFKRYMSVYDSSLSTAINSSVSSALIKINPSATIEYIKNKYPALVNDTTGLQNIALHTLSKIKTSESYRSLAQLITKHPLNNQIDYGLASSLEDSLSLTQTIFNDLLKLASDTNAAPEIAALSLTLIDSGVVAETEIKNKAQSFITSAKQLLPSFMKPDYYRYGSFSLMRILAKFNLPEANKLLEQYLDVNNIFLAYEAFDNMLKTGVSIPQKAYERFATDTSLRSKLYDKLSELNKQDAFPKKYLTQTWIAQSILYNRVSEDYGYTTVELKENKEAIFKGKKYTFYLFKINHTYGEETEIYLGVSDGYSRDKNIIKPIAEIGGINYSETLGDNDTTEMLKSYLKEKEIEDTEVATASE